MNNEVSNSQILNAITGISNRMDSMEKNLAAMVDTKISEFAEVVNKNIQEKIKCSKDIVNNKMSELEKEMSERRLDDCAEIATKVEGVIVAKLLSSNNVATESRLDQLERQARTNELVISGVPFVENENLEDILNDICKAIKFSGDANSIETYFRLPLGNVIKATANNRRRTPSIIIRFWGADAKIEFFKRYLNTKNLSTNMMAYQHLRESTLMKTSLVKTLGFSVWLVNSNRMVRFSVSTLTMDVFSSRCKQIQG